MRCSDRQLHEHPSKCPAGFARVLLPNLRLLGKRHHWQRQDTKLPSGTKYGNLRQTSCISKTNSISYCSWHCSAAEDGLLRNALPLSRYSQAIHPLNQQNVPHRQHKTRRNRPDSAGALPEPFQPAKYSSGRPRRITGSRLCTDRSGGYPRHEPQTGAWAFPNGRWLTVSWVSP